MERKIKILYFLDRMRHGGIQQLILEIAKHIDREQFEIEFLIFDDREKYLLEKTISDMGYKIYKIDGWIFNVKDYYKQAKKLDDFFSIHNDYKIIHFNSSSKNYQVLKYAQKYKIPVRIAHSHNIEFQTKNKIKIIFGNLLKMRLKKYATDYFACSKLAGEWMFGKKSVDNGKVTIIHNAIDFEKFKFNKSIRNEIRKQLNIYPDEIVVGNVGRFTNQKNHTFLIDIFNELYKRNSQYKLLLIGTGENEKIIKEKVRKLKLDKNVILGGYKSNVNEYMQAMDLFVFPSKFEGLGIVLIEAQANGLACFTTKDTVPSEAKINCNLQFISLEESAKKWAEKIIKTKIDRKNVEENFKKSGYLIDDMVKKLEKIYVE